MKKGFLYQSARNTRIPYFVTEEQAERLAAKHGGTKNGFSMPLPGYGVMEPVRWEFRPATAQELARHRQWQIAAQ